MNFELSLIIAGLLSTMAIYLGLLVYARRLRSVYNDVSRPIARALVLFGIATAFMGVIGITGIYASYLSMPIISFMLGALLITELNLGVSNETVVKRASIVVVLLSIIVFIETTLEILFSFQRFILMPILGIFLIGSLCISLYLLKESPNPFSVSIFILVVSLTIAATSAATGILGTHPEYFIIQVIPLIIGAAVLASMLRPWRHIISLTIGILAVVVGLSLAIPAYIDGDISILIFSSVAAFAGAATVIPFDFFIDQTIETKASTPMYISSTLLFVALLVITHSNNYAISLSAIGIWDPNILFMDWFFGLFGVATFTMASIAAISTHQTTRRSRETLIGVTCILLTLGHPFVINGRYELDLLYLGLMVILGLGFAGFFGVVYKLSKAGAGIAGARFLAFMFAGLAIGIVAMFADLIALEITASLLVGAGVLLIASSPRASLRRK
ncbi:MAG: hypothetical protein RTV72_11080 [Candidatus Thorarchaeota archaeon]